MCLALPYRITAVFEDGRARAEGPDGSRTIGTGLVDGLQPGSYVLVAYGSAIRVLEPDEAAELLDLVAAVTGAGVESSPD
jgi:hydrogenase assembly chaperone HypC/HupF